MMQKAEKGGITVPSEQRPYGEQNISEVLRSVSEKDGAPASQSGRPDYYEAWHEPAKTYDELEESLHSPNYHSAVRGMGDAAVVQKARREKSGAGKVLKTILLVAVCCAAGAFCGHAAANMTLDRAVDRSVPVQQTGDAEKTETEETQNSPVLPAGTASVGGELTPEEIYDIACRQCVGIQVTASGYNIFGQPVTTSPVSGSGFIVSEDGYVVTNYHVIEYALGGRNRTVTVHTWDGASYEAEVRGFDQDGDIAVLKIDAEGLNAVSMGSMDDCRVGNSVYAVGNPLGELTYTMTDGIICALDRVITTDTSFSINVFQINAAVNSGNSGGPVYNTKGQVIGIVDAKYSATGVEGIGFAIPLDDAARVIRDLVERGYVTGRAYLGVQVRTVTGAIAAYYGLPRGAYVDYVEEGSCAQTAGILPGDIITQIGSYEILGKDDVRIARTGYGAGDTVDITLVRDGTTMTTTLTFDEEPPLNVDP